VIESEKNKSIDSHRHTALSIVRDMSENKINNILEVPFRFETIR
jgi:hypothetical protein